MSWQNGKACWFGYQYVDADQIGQESDETENIIASKVSATNSSTWGRLPNGTFKIPLENSGNKDVLRIFFRAIGTSNTAGEADINITKVFLSE